MTGRLWSVLILLDSQGVTWSLGCGLRWWIFHVLCFSLCVLVGRMLVVLGYLMSSGFMLFSRHTEGYMHDIGSMYWSVSKGLKYWAKGTEQRGPTLADVSQVRVYLFMIRSWTCMYGYVLIVYPNVMGRLYVIDMLCICWIH